MIVKIEHEAGYELSLKGLALSYYDHATPIDEWWNAEKFERAKRQAKALAFKGGGHNKFLESIQVWIYVQAARSFWSEFDTYRVGITKQSSSTMHTLDKRSVTFDDFEKNTNFQSIDAFNFALKCYKDEKDLVYKDITMLKSNLPEGFKQERMISTNYMCLQNIVRQRKKHRLIYWKQFCNEILTQLQHPYLIDFNDDYTRIS